ncbi:hypothetical protein PYW08_011435 [Mythimna loreyi]|uniref:Uncharacterized protein n=1 Tax=Mythimna loreyi TaxID=667449 RepID=A0ACC2Q3I9_9NEOP|nr:hypothetical protein PYW08_011435 [Mythimna loreyi]
MWHKNGILTGGHQCPMWVIYWRSPLSKVAQKWNSCWRSPLSNVTKWNSYWGSPMSDVGHLLAVTTVQCSTKMEFLLVVTNVRCGSFTGGYHCPMSQNGILTGGHQCPMWVIYWRSPLSNMATKAQRTHKGAVERNRRQQFNNIKPYLTLTTLTYGLQKNKFTCGARSAFKLLQEHARECLYTVCQGS